jgi:hypothetical protein
MYNTYILVAIILLLATFSPLQTFLITLTGLSQVTFGLLYAIALWFIFIAIKKLITKNKENFFFEVAQPKKCSGAMFGKPNSFQFDAVGYGNCEPQKNPSYGFITGQHQCYAVGDDNSPYPKAAF